MNKDVDRLLRKVCFTPEGCWEYTGGKYGRYYAFFWNGRKRIAHRAAYELLVGPIPSGKTLEQLCNNPRCIRPDHLELMTMGENLRRADTPQGRKAAQTHCQYGHEYTPENTYTNKLGCRSCKICAREYQRRWIAANLERVRQSRRTYMREYRRRVAARGQSLSPRIHR